MSKTTENHYSYVSDYLFLNFLNTINIKKIAVTDFLEDQRGLEDWLLFMEKRGVLTPQQADALQKSPIDVQELKAFRDEWRNRLSHPEELPDSLGSLASYTKETPLYFDGRFHPVPSGGGTEGLFALLSFDMLQAFQKEVFSKLKKCESSLCYAFFIDSSGKRKWCSMEVCGNREKARRHYAKKTNAEASQ